MKETVLASICILIKPVFAIHGEFGMGKKERL